MLLRTKIRRYLLALLYSQEIPHSPECEVGPLFLNCDGEPVDVLDSSDKYIFADADPTQYKGDYAGIVIEIVSQTDMISPSKVESSTIDFAIHISVIGNSGYERQNALDLIQERIVYRLLGEHRIQDAETDQMMKPISHYADRNEITMKVTDEADHNGSYTVRTLDFSLKSRECLKQLECNNSEICFDFSSIVKAPGGCEQ